MPAITLSTDLLRLSIAPHLGAGIADFSLQGPSGFFFPLMRRAAPDEANSSLLSSFFMLPWVNRIRGGRFFFNNQHHTINTKTADGMAQHGDVRKRPWSVSSQSSNSVTLDFDSRSFSDINWPWSFTSRAVYTLTPSPRGGTLRIDLSLRNTDASPFPTGLGHHPYFSRRLWDDADDLHLSMPITARYPLKDGCAIAPAAPDDLSRHLRSLAPIPNQHIDAVFASNPPNPPNPPDPATLASPDANTAVFHWPSSAVKLSIRASANLGHWILYAPHARPDDASHPSPLAFIAVEPQSQVNDAFNLESQTGARTTGTVVLQPSEELTSRCDFIVEKA